MCLSCVKQCALNIFVCGTKNLSHSNLSLIRSVYDEICIFRSYILREEVDLGRSRSVDEAQKPCPFVKTNDNPHNFVV